MQLTALARTCWSAVSCAATARSVGWTPGPTVWSNWVAVGVVPSGPISTPRELLQAMVRLPLAAPPVAIRSRRAWLVLPSTPDGSISVPPDAGFDDSTGTGSAESRLSTMLPEAEPVYASTAMR